ncbi:hypothetical protein SCLCIDRAFT_470336 [Scleroderma citrinum Foug A]|uniref:Uncharacterized protein n=1 Tax=Scleroderma citrinum Foug A TaxID=1036808 RepID=A0A0C3EBZ4_9AGAM|nr:hypothetical protein SCLCIDRAFT_470336 [Scleroderma citrinum Foug A]
MPAAHNMELCKQAKFVGGLGQDKSVCLLNVDRTEASRLRRGPMLRGLVCRNYARRHGNMFLHHSVVRTITGLQGCPHFHRMPSQQKHV